MSLSGLFLIVFLIVHLLGNLQLLKSDDGMAFNLYTYFMTHNPLIKTISYILYTCILIHTIQGIYIYRQNRNAKGTSYAVKTNVGDSFFSRYMVHLGIIIFLFLLLHLWQFWLQMKLGNLPMVEYPGKDHPYKDLYNPVVDAFRQPIYVFVYVISMVILAFHLLHGFQSAFQSLGIRHSKYTPFIKTIGWIYAILIPLGFALIPIIIYFNI